MNIISRYILREFLKILLMTLLGFVLVFLIVDFLDRIDNFLEVQIPLSRVAYYFLMSVPSVIFHMTPVSVLVAVLISLGLLARNSEIVALKASGVSLYRLAIPIFLSAVLLSLLCFVLSDIIIPRTSAQANAIWNVEVEKQQDLSSPVHRDIWFRSESGLLNLRVYDRLKRTMNGVSFYRLNDGFRLVERTEAKSARWVNDRWEFHDGLVKTYLPDGQLSVRRFKREMINLPEMPDKFTQVTSSAEEMNFSELSDWIRRMEAEGYDPLRYEVDLHLKLSFPFICAIMALIGLPIAFWKEKGGGIALGVGVGIGLSFMYIVFLGLSRSLGYSGLVPPVVAAWMPNLVFTLLGFFLFTNVRQ
ncbi:MAG: LPS export ABC transporter permease LptG [Deltaproteobacteria bacterium]|nr:LPS export ABC transporter permease LptG [Deltaproteobacteria bacterium]